MIKLGVCRGIEDAQIAYESGFDYIECNFSQVMALPRAEFDEWKKRMQDMPIRCEAMNGMLPGTFRLTGPDADLTPVREFLKEAFARAAERHDYRNRTAARQGVQHNPARIRGR